ncbi:PAS domain-containing hybrid sensor histidine kinase/response regulator [Falsiroseomonas selenitidurans]|uniref:histidine kinase n=1 Tax=Falsiroseomonas selenitidurans TaxID=2716335 RepID=A0ABX1EDW6_9PROT|nr:PAS domain-containing hybrid sensor histidine kinase/response regulator [Falsiroseomonas selenitidurans]NKC34077.1 response regulator [Falsiroseomonas selenitidurans]
MRIPSTPEFREQDVAPAAAPLALVTPKLDAVLERIARLARHGLGVAGAGCVLGEAAPPPAGAGFAQDVPLTGRGSDLLGTFWLRDDRPRAALSPREQAMLADLAAMAVDAVQRQQNLEWLELCKRLLWEAAEAPGFAAAVERAMAVLRDATDCMLCLFFRLAPDRVNMHLVAGQARTPELTTAYLEHLRRTVVRVDNSLVGQVALAGEQVVMPEITAEVRQRYPAISLSVHQQVGANIVTPISLGSERYAFGVSFAPGTPHLPALAEMMACVAGALRPMLRRLLDAEAVTLNEQRFRLVAQATAETVWDWDLHAQRVWWSDGMLAQFGHHPPDPTPPGWWESLLAPEDAPRVLQGRRAVLQAGSAWQEEYRMRRADGGLALVLDRGHVIRDGEGVPQRMVGSLVDVTQQRAMEDQIRQSQRLDALGRLTGGVAHDFNNLLAVIIGNAELLADDLPNRPDLLGPLEVILAAAERGAALTGRLLTFARLHPLAPQVLDVNQLLAGVEPLLRRLIGAAVTVRFIAQGGHAHALVDGPQLENAVLNLCINARDAMPEGGELCIETALLHHPAEPEPGSGPDIPPGDYVVIAVRDTGMGMSRAVAARAFEPFFTTKEFGRGSGLGLSMVFGFVSQSKGHVRLETEPGRGTCVTLYLPHAVQAPEVAAADAAEAAMPCGQGVILLVEDDPALRRTTAAQLGRLGYEVRIAPDGEAALTRLQAGPPPDLLITDLIMPGTLNGHQLARQARALWPGLRVLFSSGYHELAMVEADDLARGFQLLQKPYRLAELAQAVRLLMEAPRG